MAPQDIQYFRGSESKQQTIITIQEKVYHETKLKVPRFNCMMTRTVKIQPRGGNMGAAWLVGTKTEASRRGGQLRPLGKEENR